MLGDSTLKWVLMALAFFSVWLFVRWRSPSPEAMPLATSNDDPLMQRARAQAKAALPEFRALLQTSEKDHTVIKLRFVSSSQQVEYLWAEVVEVLSDQELGIRLVTPPVTHSGPLDRLHRCSLEDVEDWQVRDAAGIIHGAFTQRAMFAIARRDNVKLPRNVRAQEAFYPELPDTPTTARSTKEQT